jgi:hypothetical protein
MCHDSVRFSRCNVRKVDLSAGIWEECFVVMLDESHAARRDETKQIVVIYC